jgi:uncharacterized protein
MFILPTDYWRIVETKNKGRGVFVEKEIAPGTVIGDYLGKIIPVDNDEDDNNEIFAMEIDDELLVDPDVNSVGIHLINHSCSPNCFIFPFKGHMLYVSLRKIFAKEELTVSYLIEEDHEGHHHFCYCESPFCHGTMYIPENYNEKLCEFYEKMNSSETKILTPVGEQLPPLEKYPSSINEDYEIFDLFANLNAKPLNLNDDKIPNLKTLRNLIRKNGSPLHFSNLNYYVLGITHEKFIVGRSTL